LKIIEKKLNNHKVILTIFYSFIFSVGIVYFLAPASLISTGLTGIAQILVFLEAGLPIQFGFSAIYLVLNIPGLVLGYYKIGKKFTTYSLISVLTVTFFTAILPVIVITEDIILNSLVAGVIIGYSLGGLLRIGASSGGTDFYGIYLYERFGFDFTKVNLFINTIIILSSMYIYSVEIGLYTFLCFIVRQFMVNYTYTNNNKLTVWIVGDDLSKVSTFINQKLGRGTSIFTNVQGGYSRNDKEVIMTILNESQYRELRNNVKIIAPDAFVSANSTISMHGNYARIKELK